MGSNQLFENHVPIKNEDEQQNTARKNNFKSEERSKTTLSKNTIKLMGSLQELHAASPAEATGSAYFQDNNRTNVFKHNVGAAQRDGLRIGEMLGRRRLNPRNRAELMEQANILGTSDANNTDATVHAQAQGQARAYSRNERADVARFANNRGSGFSREPSAYSGLAGTTGSRRRRANGRRATFCAKSKTRSAGTHARASWASCGCCSGVRRDQVARGYL